MLSKSEYLEAATSSNGVYDRFVRKLRRFRNTGVNFNKTESNRRAYLKRRELAITERVENCLQTLKTLSKHVMDGTSWMLLIQEGDTKRLGRLCLSTEAH